MTADLAGRSFGCALTVFVTAFLLGPALSAQQVRGNPRVDTSKLDNSLTKTLGHEINFALASNYGRTLYRTPLSRGSNRNLKSAPFVTANKRYVTTFRQI